MVVGIAAGHKLRIFAIRVGQCALPGLGELVVCPGKKLLTGRNVMVGYVDDAAFLSVVVAAEEVILGGGREVGGRALGVGVLLDVDIFTEADAVIGARVIRPGANGAVVVKVHIGDILREEDLVVFVDRHRGVLPPEEGACERGSVAYLNASFEDGFAGCQSDSDHSFHPFDGVVFGEPDRYRAILAVLDLIVYRHEGRGAVMVGPVKLDSPRDPISQSANERGFDDTLLVEKVVARGFIESGEDASSDLRKNLDFEKLVFETDDLVFPFDLLRA